MRIDLFDLGRYLQDTLTCLPNESQLDSSDDSHKGSKGSLRNLHLMCSTLLGLGRSLIDCSGLEVDCKYLQGMESLSWYFGDSSTQLDM